MASIETGWNEGIKSKTTLLGFDGAAITLDHTRQLVRLPGCRPCCTDGERLVNQYVEVFKDFRHRLGVGRDNLDVAAQIHRVLFRALT